MMIRANSAADELLPRLQNTQIPCYFVANKGLYKKTLINDLISYMRSTIIMSPPAFTACLICPNSLERGRFGHLNTSIVIKKPFPCTRL